jgi:hypothetical protein
MGIFLREYVAFRNVVNCTITEAVITWIISLPLIILTVIALLDPSQRLRRDCACLGQRRNDDLYQAERIDQDLIIIQKID